MAVWPTDFDLIDRSFLPQAEVNDRGMLAEKGIADHDMPDPGLRQ